MSSLNHAPGPGRRHAPMSAIRGIKLLLIVILKPSTLSVAGVRCNRGCESRPTG